MINKYFFKKLKEIKHKMYRKNNFLVSHNVTGGDIMKILWLYMYIYIYIYIIQLRVIKNLVVILWISAPPTN